jgi:hypothetical protein
MHAFIRKLGDLVYSQWIRYGLSGFSMSPADSREFGDHNETSWRRTSSLFSGESSLIASTISSTVDMA